METDLALPPPAGEDGRPLGTRPAIRAAGVAIDPQGRIVVTGGAVIGLARSCVHDVFEPEGVSAGFVARFNEGGELDTGFGNEGLVGGLAHSRAPLGAEQIGEPVVGPAGDITYRATGSFRCRRARNGRGIGRLTAAGRPSAVFGTRGAIRGAFRALAEGPDGSIVALAGVPHRRGGDPIKARLIRFEADGRIDRSFGDDGRTGLTFGRGASVRLDSLAVDRRGRVIVGGVLETDSGRGIVLLRVSGHGRREEKFGPHGRVVTSVGHLDQVRSGDLFFDPLGRLVTVRRYTDAGDSGLVVARYLIRDRRR